MTDLILEAQGKLEPLVQKMLTSTWGNAESPAGLQIITSQEGIS